MDAIVVKRQRGIRNDADPGERMARQYARAVESPAGYARLTTRWIAAGYLSSAPIIVTCRRPVTPAITGAS